MIWWWWLLTFVLKHYWPPVIGCSNNKLLICWIVCADFKLCTDFINLNNCNWQTILYCPINYNYAQLLSCCFIGTVEWLSKINLQNQHKPTGWLYCRKSWFHNLQQIKFGRSFCFLVLNGLHVKPLTSKNFLRMQWILSSAHWAVSWMTSFNESLIPEYIPNKKET